MTTQSQAYSPPAASCIPDERALRRAPKDRVLSSLSTSQTRPLRVAALATVRLGRIDHPHRSVRGLQLFSENKPQTSAVIF